MPHNKVKVFSTHPGDFTDKPFMAEIQLQSWDWFVKEGIKKLFKEVSPIADYTGEEYELYFQDYYFDEPKFSEDESWQRGATYEAALRAKVKLVNLKDKKRTMEQEVYLGDYPIMTDRGTFIVNGVERVVVSQFIRSAGVYFTTRSIKGKRCFGAKVIPDRGSWLEFESEPDGFIGVKIDKHRKVPVTCLLRVFGLETKEAIEKAFSKVDVYDPLHIPASFKKDTAENVDDSYIEIYKRLRPGDLASVDNARGLIDGMFKRNDRFSLSEVGRFKVNERLELNADPQEELLRQEDIVEIVREIIRLNNNADAQPDDIDALYNRRVRSVGELVQGRMRVGFARMRRIIQDRMSTYNPEDITPLQIINPKPLSSVVREFLVSSQLSQFMDQINPLSELEHKRRLSAMGPGGLTRERAGFEVRDVHTSHYGRVCPIQTPEGQNIGLINQLSSFAATNRLGFLETPYAEVKNGKLTGTIEWMTAQQERKYKIAEGGTPVTPQGGIIESRVEARFDGVPGVYDKKEIDYIDVSPTQTVSAATSIIPFLEHDDANRALMGSNMQRQAVPSLKPDAPLVGTGVEELIARDSGRTIVAPESGEVIKADASSVVLKTTKGTVTYPLRKFRRSNQYTTINQRCIVKPGDKVKKGDVLVDGPSTDHGVLALGQNLKVAFVPYFGGNFEDAIVLSERVAQQDRFTSIHIEDYLCDVRDTKLGAEQTTADIPNVSEEKLKNLDEEGIIRIGAEVGPGDILVGKISPKGETELTAEEKLLRSIFGEKARDVKDTSLYLPHGKSGRVVGIKIFSRERGDKLEPGVIKRIQVDIAQLRKVRAGDKLAGRHGNKGVISQIRPVEDMPYLEDGTPVDIVLNPLGVASRMNLGQILETHLGLAAHTLGYRAVTPVFVGASEDDIARELHDAGFSANGKMAVYDGRTGKKIGNDVTVGYIYMLKLNHLVEDKIHMRSIGPYSLVTQQPLGGKAQFGGQRFGEMEVWALEGYGSAYTLQEMLTIKSDDVLGRASAFESLVKGEDIRPSDSPSAFNVLVNEINALGMKLEPVNKEDLPSNE